jgi:hypothetical protein
VLILGLQELNLTVQQLMGLTVKKEAATSLNCACRSSCLKAFSKPAAEHCSTSGSTTRGISTITATQLTGKPLVIRHYQPAMCKEGLRHVM